jgi:DNA excision repair protein ERCC-2
MIVPETTTKFTERNPKQYQQIALAAARIVNAVPGNSAVFFPSYRFRDDVYAYFEGLCRKTTFIEVPGMNKEEKTELLEKFKLYKDAGAVLLAVAAANYAEGIDLPGDLLKAVVVVGLPLQKPDLETKELIDYYDKKYAKGWDYAYIFPAITKCLQSAGRCIRSETDRGVIVFLDERFAWPKYRKCFPPDSNIIITRLYEEKIANFFRQF